MKQNASAVVRQAVAGEIVTITDRGRPVAQLTAITESSLDRMLDAGQARAALRKPSELPAPDPGPALGAVVEEMRRSTRY